MFKKSVLLFTVIIMLFTLSGCQIVDMAKNAISDESSGEELYYNINNLIVSPDSSSYERLPRKFDFTAMILSEPFTIEVENEDGVFEEGTYISAGISRNMDDYFLINIGDKEFDFDIYDIVTVTTDYYSSIYWTEEGSRIELAVFKANDIKLYSGESVEPKTGDTIEIQNRLFKGEFSFKKVKPAKDAFGEVIVLYFDFKNTDEKDGVPSLNIFNIYQGDSYMKNSIMAVSSEIEEGALELSIGNGTYAGKTQYYYTPLKAQEQEGVEYDITAPIYIDLYDDNYNLIYTHEITIDNN